MNYCGLCCEKCEFQSPCACRGCPTPFFGSCQVADCARKKDLPHCGSCPDFPCQILLSCAHDPLTGDNGNRITALKHE